MPLIGREVVSSIAAVLLAVSVALGIVYGLLQLSEVSAAIAFIAVAAFFGALWWGWGPRIERMRRFRQGIEVETPVAHQSPAFLGQDEFVKELERVEAWCVHFGGIADSIRDVSPTIMELDHLWIGLTEVKNEFRGIWSLTRQNEVVMIVNELRKASSALSRKDLEDTKSHVDGARKNAKSLIRELKAPPSS